MIHVTQRILLVVVAISCLSYIMTNESYKCNVFRCSQFELPKNQCIYSHPFSTNNTIDYNIYDISLKCPEGTGCPLEYNSNNVTCVSQKPLEQLKVDKEPCKNNTDCSSNVCNNNVCVGLAPLAVCIAHSQCTTGYYCGKLTPNSLVQNCIPQLKGGDQCESDFDCPNSHGCLLTNRTCVEFFTLPVGAQVSSGGSVFCQTMKSYEGHCVSTKLQQTTDECSSVNGTLQSVCNYTMTGYANQTTYESECQCSKAYSNKKFCEYDTEHPEWQKLINALKEYTHHDVVGKHTSRRNDYAYPLKRQVYTVMTYPEFRDADDCAINIEISSSYTKFSMMLVGFLLVFLA